MPDAPTAQPCGKETTLDRLDHLDTPTQDAMTRSTQDTKTTEQAGHGITMTEGGRDHRETRDRKTEIAAGRVSAHTGTEIVNETNTESEKSMATTGETEIGKDMTTEDWTTSLQSRDGIDHDRQTATNEVDLLEHHHQEDQEQTTTDNVGKIEILYSNPNPSRSPKSMAMSKWTSTRTMKTLGYGGSWASPLSRQRRT